MILSMLCMHVCDLSKPDIQILINTQIIINTHINTQIISSAN